LKISVSQNLGVQFSGSRVDGVVIGVLRLAGEVLHQRVRDADVEFVAEVDAPEIGIEYVVLGEKLRFLDLGAHAQEGVANALPWRGQELIRSALEQVVGRERKLKGIEPLVAAKHFLVDSQGKVVPLATETVERSGTSPPYH
jgi:hypothetical protein